MSAEQTPRALRHIIAIIGRRNAGKSSLLNALTEQDISIVSPEAGTTTDAVAKPYELLPLGPVTFYDTAGLDDDSSLGQQRIKSTRKALYKADVAVLVVNEGGLGSFEKQIAADVREMQIPLVAAFNKCDKATLRPEDETFCRENNIPYTVVSALENKNITQLKELIIAAVPEENKRPIKLLDGLVEAKDSVILVTPIDTSAPKGRLILPQVQILREVLDTKAFATVTQTEELADSLAALKDKPRIVITDSQAILQVDKIVPPEIALTTFSILFARHKADLQIMAEGAKTIDRLENGDKILIAEACSHHAQDDDIAKVKIPNWLSRYTGKKFEFSFRTGSDFPENLEEYRLVIHCGACMLNKAEMNRRLRECVRRGVPITNYGIAISKTQGVLERVIKPFGL